MKQLKSGSGDRLIKSGLEPGRLLQFRSSSAPEVVGSYHALPEIIFEKVALLDFPPQYDTYPKLQRCYQTSSIMSRLLAVHTLTFFFECAKYFSVCPLRLCPAEFNSRRLSNSVIALGNTYALFANFLVSHSVSTNRPGY